VPEQLRLEFAPERRQECRRGTHECVRHKEGDGQMRLPGVGRKERAADLRARARARMADFTLYQQAREARRARRRRGQKVAGGGLAG
jgi:hypothetical protein